MHDATGPQWWLIALEMVGMMVLIPLFIAGCKSAFGADKERRDGRSTCVGGANCVQRLSRSEDEGASPWI